MIIPISADGKDGFYYMQGSRGSVVENIGRYMQASWQAPD